MAESLDKWQGTITPIIAEACGRSEEEIIALYMDHEDHELTYREAVDEGLVNEIGGYEVPASNVKEGITNYNNIIQLANEARVAASAVPKKNVVVEKEKEKEKETEDLTNTNKETATADNPEAANEIEKPEDTATIIANLKAENEALKAAKTTADAGTTKQTTIPAKQDNSASKGLSEDQIKLNAYNKKVADEMARDEHFYFSDL